VLGVRAEEGERELKSEGERCGCSGGWGVELAFYIGRGSIGDVVTGNVKALTQLMVGRGYEGVKPGE
jgi:hypothetical protein